MLKQCSKGNMLKQGNKETHIPKQWTDTSQSLPRGDKVKQQKLHVKSQDNTFVQGNMLTHGNICVTQNPIG